LILLSRINILQQVMSQEIAYTLRSWHDREKILSCRFEPFDISGMRRKMGLLKETNRILRSALAGSMEVTYEYLYGPPSVDERLERFWELAGYAGYERPVEVPEKVRCLLSNRIKLNNFETYRLVPNAAEIAAELGSEEDGFMFDEISNAKCGRESR
jgi:hypothetical protein